MAGVVWEWVWSPPTQVVEQHQLFYTDYGSLRQVFTGTGLYVLVSVVASALTALAAGLLTRRHELLVLAAVTLGSLAAAYTMHAVGVALGPPDPAQLAKTAADGTHLSAQLVVNGKTPYLVWPMVSLFVLSLVFFALPGVRMGPPPRRHDDRTHRSGRDGDQLGVGSRAHAPHGAEITGSTILSEQQPPSARPSTSTPRAGLLLPEAPADRAAERSRSRRAWLVGGGLVGLLPSAPAPGPRSRSSSRAPSPPRPCRRRPSPTPASTSTQRQPEDRRVPYARQVPGLQGPGRDPQRRRRPPEARRR